VAHVGLAHLSTGVLQTELALYSEFGREVSAIQAFTDRVIADQSEVSLTYQAFASVVSSQVQSIPLLLVRFSTISFNRSCRPSRMYFEHWTLPLVISP
jgi:hypothetical protein